MKLPQAVEDYAKLIRNRQSFKQANFGDGEWACIAGEIGRNCDGHEYSAALRSDLIASLDDRGEYIRGSNAKGLPAMACAEWRHLPWVSKEILPNANCRGELGPFIHELRKADVMVVGPRHLVGAMDCVFRPAVFLEVPERNAYDVCDLACDGVRRALFDDSGIHVVCLSVGLMAAVMASRLHRTFRALTVIDCGALWDGYCGVFSRKGYRKASFKDAMRKNLETA